MKKIGLLIFVTMLISCGDDGGSSNADLPNKMIMNSPKSLFISNNSSFYAKTTILEKIRNLLIPSAYADSTTDKLYQINEDGLITLVDFIDSEGNKINVIVSDLKKISTNYITMNLCVKDQYYQVVGHNSTGKLYKIDDVDIRYAVTELTETGEILINKNQTLLKLNLETMKQIPLNNSQHQPIDSPCFITIYEDYLNGSYKMHFIIPQKDDTFVVYDCNDQKYYKFDIMGINPPTILTQLPFLMTSPFAYSRYIDLAYQIPILAPNNSMYVFRSQINSINLSIDGGSEIVIATTPRSKSLDINHNYEVFETERLLIYRNGYIIINAESDGSLVYQWYGKNMNFIFDANSEAKYYHRNGTIYCLTDNVFKKANPIDDTEYTIIYTHPTPVLESWLVNEDIIFTAYITATHIGTYQIPKEATTATKIDDSEMHITDVIEFSIP